MTIADVLAQINWPLGRHGRTTCPIHRGGNSQAFSYKDEVYSCHVCGEKGNVFLLKKALGLLEERPRRPPPRAVVGLIGAERMRASYSHATKLTYTYPPGKPSERLYGALRALQGHRREEAVRLHREGSYLQRLAGRILSGALVVEREPVMGLPLDIRRWVPADPEARFEMAADLWVTGQEEIDAAHTALDCGCDELRGTVVCQRKGDTGCWLVMMS